MNIHGRAKYPVNSIIGFLFRNGQEDAARFIIRDSKKETRASHFFLITYEEYLDEVSFPGLELAGRDPEDFISCAKRDPAGASFLFLLDHLSGAQIYKQAMERSKNPDQITALINLTGELFGKDAFRLVEKGLLSRDLEIKYEVHPYGFAAAVQRGLENLDLTKEEYKKANDYLRNTVQKRMHSLFDFGRKVEAKAITQACNDFREIFEDRDEADRKIREIIQQKLIMNFIHYPDYTADHLRALFDEAEKAGMNTEAVINFLLAPEYEKVGRPRLEKAVTAGPGVFRFLAEKLIEVKGEEKGGAILADLLARPADKNGPALFVQGKSTTLADRLAIVARIHKFDKGALAEIFQRAISKVTGDSYEKTAMHRSWASSRMLGPPQNAGQVDEDVSGFIKAIDDTFGTDIALPMAAQLFALKNARGDKPLHAPLGEGPEGRYSRYYYEAIVINLADKLKDDAKFTRYMENVIVPNLPDSFWPPEPKPSKAAEKYLPKKPEGPEPG